MAKSSKGNTGGPHLSGNTIATGGGDFVMGDKVRGDKVGRDKNVQSQTNLQELFTPIADVIEASTPDRRAAANQKLDALKKETAKGKDANDSVIAKLLEDIVGLAPSAVQAIVAAFANPILGKLAGPVTKYILDKFKPKQASDTIDV